MEFKGTKGEWYTTGRTNLRVKTNIGNLITPICDLDNFDKSINESQSNAKLIASAPDLLEALQRCNKVLATYNSSKAVDAYLIARKAIEKALL